MTYIISRILIAAAVLAVLAFFACFFVGIDPIHDDE